MECGRLEEARRRSVLGEDAVELLAGLVDDGHGSGALLRRPGRRDLLARHGHLAEGVPELLETGVDAPGHGLPRRGVALFGHLGPALVGEGEATLAVELLPGHVALLFEE